MLSALTVQQEKGNISQIETARLQALLLSLRQEQDQAADNVVDLEAHLRVLTAMDEKMHPVALFSPSSINDDIDIDQIKKQLLDSISGRADVKLAYANKQVAEAQLRAERAAAYPEIHLTGQYDRNAGYFPNFFTIGATLSIPLFNQNQGNIRAAKTMIAESEAAYANTLSKAQNEVAVACDGFIRSLALEKAVADDFDKQNVEKLFTSVNDNYRKRNISLLEFVDFYKTYKDVMLQASSVKEQVFLSAEDLNTAAGQELIKY